MNNKSSLLLDEADSLILEDMLYSSSSDSEEEEGLLNLLGHVVTPQVKTPRITIKSYCEEVVPTYSDQDFHKHFRLKRDLVNFIIQRFESSPEYQSLLTTYSRVNITPEKHILVFLWFAGHQTALFRDVGDRFDLAISSLYEVLTRVMNCLCNMRSEFINLPNTQQMAKTKNYYRLRGGLPDIVGIIDGSHIKIDTPSTRHTDYFNRKNFYSINMQGLCNEECRFLDICVGFPGSVHDARVFRNSSVYNKLNEFCVNGAYILGDSAYPILPFLMKPYQDNGHLTPAQKHFNRIFSSCRVTIEHGFGLLKQRFRQLYHVKLRGIRRICQFIMACCVLHNLAVGDNLIFDNEEYFDAQPETITLKEIHVDQLTKEGNIIRNKLCQSLFLDKRNKAEK